MIITFVHRGLRPDKEVQEHLCERIERLAKLLHIEVAEVTLERSGPSGPPFIARLHLAVAGPDLYAEERDHTPEATIHKVLAKLTRQIRHRKRKLLTKRRSGEECGSWTEVALPLALQTA